MYRELRSRTSTKSGGRGGQAAIDDLRLAQKHDLTEREVNDTCPVEFSTSKRRCKRSFEDSPFSTANPDDAICRQCEAVDFDAIFRIRGKGPNGFGKLVAQLGPLDSSAISSCALCRFFAALHIDALSTTSTTTKYALRAVYAGSYFSAKSKISGLPDTVMLAVVPEGARTWRHAAASYIYSAPPTGSTPRDRIMGQIRGERVDFGKIREWLKFCEVHHTIGCCQVEVVTLSGFKLIDCHTRQIVPAPKTNDYLALSYVGGKGLEEPQAIMGVLPNPAPLVIEDAITVAIKLDVQYLWVDRYCIHQDGDDKDHQIRNMDLIYRGAKLTIIAAAGDDPSFGLPGISSANRTLQPMIRVRGHLLVSSLADPVLELKKSKWASRGWTYQEGLLSRRRLVFTKSQVLFQYLTRFRDIVTGGRAFPPGGIGRSHSDLMERIREYSQKELSFEHDALNAFLGVLHAYEKLGVISSHVTGVPSLVRVGERWGSESKVVDTIARDLSWTVGQNAAEFLQRREGFPSWSWVGWSGSELRNFRILYGGRFLVKASDISVELEGECGQLMPWVASTLLKIFPRRIHVSGWTTELRIMKTSSDLPQCWALDEMDYWGGKRGCRLDLTIDPKQNPQMESALVEELYIGLVISWIDPMPYDQKTTTVLILNSTKDGTCERIGIGSVFFGRECFQFLERDDLGIEVIIRGRKFVRQRLVLE